MRASVDETWTAVAQAVAARSRCSRSQVGAVIVSAEGRIVATGYNGPPRGHQPSESWPSCTSFCPRAIDGGGSDQDFTNCPSVHAELNAILYCDRLESHGATMYVTKSPCLECCKAIAQAGIAEVVWPFGGSQLDDNRGLEAHAFLRRVDWAPHKSIYVRSSCDVPRHG